MRNAGFRWAVTMDLLTKGPTLQKVENRGGGDLWGSFAPDTLYTLMEMSFMELNAMHTENMYILL